MFSRPCYFYLFPKLGGLGGWVFIELKNSYLFLKPSLQQIQVEGWGNIYRGLPICGKIDRDDT